MRPPPIDFLCRLAVKLGPATLLAFCFGAPGLASEPAQAFALHSGDRVVFYGDSITQDGGYASFVEAYCRSRFPTWDLRFYNSGVGGDTVKGGGSGEIGLRLERDVIRLKPTVVTLMLGMNDGGYKKLDSATLAGFTDGYRAIVIKLKQALPGVRIYLIRSSPFDDFSRPPNFSIGYADVLRQMGDAVAAIGREQHVEVVDFGGVVTSGVRDAVLKNPDRAKHLLPDRVHPSPAGHILMGATLLRAWRAPAVVSRVEIDVGAGKLSDSEDARVTALNFREGGVAWNELDGSLPLPLDFGDANTELAEVAHADLDSIDSEDLVLKGLPHGKYELRIDDQSIGTFTDSEFSQGINLARYNTPMRWQAYQARWGADNGQTQQRLQRQLLYGADGDPAVISAADLLGRREELDQSNRSHAVLPKERHFSVTPIP